MKLIITEKPSVAQNIAAALGVTKREDGYMEGNGYLISWCVGHLVELAQPVSYGEQYQKWTYESLPLIPENWNYEIKEDTKGQFGVLASLMKKSDVETVVCATDAGREGELIFRLVYKMTGCNKPVERLWISSMEEKAIREGFDNLKPGKEYDNLYQSALCRQQADWLVGINGTRLFTVLYRSKVLKVGRVQTPTLSMLADRETAIMNFHKEPFYTVVLHLDGMTAVSEKFKTREEAEEAASMCNEEAVVISYESDEKTVNPPALFDLTTLQREANRLFGFTAKQTLEYAQSLYEKKYITYPRTDSSYVTEDMEGTINEVAHAINEHLEFAEPFDKDIRPDIRRIMNNRKVTDHHAIIPTMEIANEITDISDGETKILNLISDRVLCATGTKHVYVSEKAEIDCNGIRFTMTRKHVKDNGWKTHEDSLRLLYGLKDVSEQDNDDVEEQPEESGTEIGEGEIITVGGTEVKEGTTKPPERFTEATLLHAMEIAGAKEMSDDVERKGLGTPATRADIIEKLVRDGYVTREKKKLVPTDDGMKLITVLPDMVKSPQMTADWENELALIAKGDSSPADFMDSISDMVSDMVRTYNSISDEEKKKFFRPEQEPLGECPKCKEPVYKGKFGAYCSGKCGMQLNKAMGATLSENEVKSLLQGKKILVKSLRNKAGKVYDAYLNPTGITEFSYAGEDGKTHSGYQFRFDMTFPKKKKE